MSLSFALLKWMLLLSSVGLPNDWPAFRGPTGDGRVAGPATPLVWSDTNHVVWQVPIQGLGWSSPSVVDGVVYLTTAVQEEERLSLRALAISADDGRVIWDREVNSVETVPSIHAKNSHASPTPVIHDGAVYVHFGTYGTACLQASDGSIVWINREIDYPPMHGSGGSPVLHDGVLVIICDGSSDPFVVAIEASSGKQLWKRPRSVEARISHSFGTAAIATVDGRAQVIAPGPEHLAAYDLTSGEELWQVRAPGWSVVPVPIFYRDLVIYNRDYDNPELLAVRLGGRGDVTDTHVVWRLKRGAPSTPTPVLVGDELYFVSDKGVVTCADAATGEVHWTERIGGNYSASPLAFDDRLLLLDEDGHATWLALGKEYRVLGTNDVTGRTLATPAFVDGAMYLRTDTTLTKYVDPNR
ncbi:MAG TPA: PQQ-binding-like beta-propeller repeat protein [Pirellulaceae bacterium]|nr:PQQ-binding-like beta-propeller repeat protein [Pirellulaceae bacterium]